MKKIVQFSVPQSEQVCGTLLYTIETVRRIIKGDIVVPPRVPKPQSNAEKKILDCIQLIPMMESHYARQKSEKKYVSLDFQTMNEFFKVYKRQSDDAKLPFVKKTKFNLLKELEAKRTEVLNKRKIRCNTKTLSLNENIIIFRC